MKTRIRFARFHMSTPGPYGSTYHTSNVAEVRQAMTEGWEVHRVRMLPADPDRLAALIAAERNR